MRKRFVCGLLALALFVFTLPAAMAASSDVVYLGDAGSDGNSARRVCENLGKGI